MPGENLIQTANIGLPCTKNVGIYVSRRGQKYAKISASVKERKI